MQIILDSNVLFSALIKDSFTRKVLLDYSGKFLFPEYIFSEIETHKTEILSKSGITVEEVNTILSTITQKVLIVPNSVLNTYFKEAMNIIKDIDPNDAIFIACALAYPGSIIWSDDKKLKNQSVIKILNTQEISQVI
jgi:predicted nucleic acid-binding protein